MSKYSLKFTTLKEWKPELLSEDENPENPICLILDEAQEAVAMLVPHVDKTLTESFIFHSESETKIFNNMNEACEFVGLQQKDADCAKFVNNTQYFMLTEKARLENLNPYYDGIHTPHNDALRLYEARRLFNENTQEVLTEDLVDKSLQPSKGVYESAKNIFNICNKYKGITFLIFNNQAYLNSMVENSEFKLLIDNFQCKFKLSEIYAIGQDNNNDVVKTYNKNEVETFVLPLFRKNIGALQKDERSKAIFVNDNGSGLTIAIELKNTAQEVSINDLTFNNLNAGYVLETTSNGDSKEINVHFAKMNNEYSTIADISKNISKLSHYYTFEAVKDGEGKVCVLSNGLTVIATQQQQTSFALTITKDGELINNGDTEALMKKGIPSTTMRLNEQTMMNVLNSLEQMNFSKKNEVDTNKFFNKEDFEKRLADLNDGNTEEITFNFPDNDYMATISKLDDAYYMKLSSKRNTESAIDDYFVPSEQRDSLREIINKCIGTKTFPKEIITVNRNDPNLTSNDIFKDHFLPLVINFTGKKPHNLSAIVKFIAKDNNKQSTYSITVREQSSESKLKNDTYYDVSVEDLLNANQDDTRYPMLKEFLVNEGLEFPTTDKSKVIKCLNFIKNNDIGTTSYAINNIVNSEANRDKDIRYIFPKDVPLTEKDILDDFKGKKVGDTVYYIFAKILQNENNKDIQTIKSSDFTDSVIAVTLTGVKEINGEKQPVFSYEYKKYSERRDVEKGYEPFEIKPIFKNGEIFTGLHQNQTLGQLVTKFEETQKKPIIQKMRR